MTAKEMFEELGFEFIKENDGNIAYYKDLVFGYGYIKFWLDKKEYMVEERGECATMTAIIHKAIHKQLEELGWLK